tara:strand:+ start:207 stop:437 length:231 start_codon:yes stop_codon:yes gene_type:complete
MKQPLNLRNSIYQQKNVGAFEGLTVKDGMLINNRPDGQTGIAQAAQMKKAIHRAEKISTMAAAYSLGEMGESCGCD